MLSVTPIREVEESAELLAWFELQREVHVYGLADLDDKFWTNSRWFRRDDAVVGIVKLPGDEPFNVVYAISASAPSATIRLLLDLSSEIPDGSLGTAPIGAVNWMRDIRSIKSLGPHHKMSITRTTDLGETTNVVTLGSGDLDDLLELYAQDPGAAFFLPSMLEDGLWAGTRQNGKLVSAGGTHVLSSANNVAALGGILTDPDARGQGLAAGVTSFLVKQLSSRGFTIGLNVHADNLSARRLYRSLGFEYVHEYEEFEILSS